MTGTAFISVYDSGEKITNAICWNQDQIIQYDRWLGQLGYYYDRQQVAYVTDTPNMPIIITEIIQKK